MCFWVHPVEWIEKTLNKTAALCLLVTYKDKAVFKFSFYFISLVLVLLKKINAELEKNTIPYSVPLTCVLIISPLLASYLKGLWGSVPIDSVKYCIVCKTNKQKLFWRMCIYIFFLIHVSIQNLKMLQEKP